MKKLTQLQNSTNFRLLLEHSQEIILFFDQAGHILECNQTAKDELGYGADIYRILISDIFRMAMKIENNKLIINPKYRNEITETVAYRNNQTCFAVNLIVTIETGNKSFNGLCTALNISEEKKLIRNIEFSKKELVSSSQLKNEFMANITHELRTPVNGIMGLSENLLEFGLQPKQVEIVNIIHRCCKNMNTIINDLLDYTKIANNKLVLENREFDFRHFIEGIIAININGISEKGLKLLTNIADDIPNIIIGDEFRLAQILNNLFSNAIKFTSLGQIVLEVDKTAQTESEVELLFMIMDTGIGISIEERDKLFLSFSQVDGSITRRFGGTGLGLSISKMLVESMKGTIAVESQKNKGSTFSFTVRMGINKAFEETGKVQSDEVENYFFPQGEILSDKEGLFSDFTGDDNIKTRNKVDETSQLKQGILFKTDSDDSYDHKGVLEDLYDTFEKLAICIEMESWEKAEVLANRIKNLIPKDHKKVSEKSLKLVLSVRKENHDTSIAILGELITIVNEASGWRM